MKYIDAWANKANLASTTWRFLYSTTPFCCGVLGYDNQRSMHDWLRMREKALNSLPQSNWDIWYCVKLVFYKICWIEEIQTKIDPLYVEDTTKKIEKNHPQLKWSIMHQ